MVALFSEYLRVEQLNSIKVLLISPVNLLLQALNSLVPIGAAIGHPVGLVLLRDLSSIPVIGVQY